MPDSTYSAQCFFLGHEMETDEGDIFYFVIKTIIKTIQVIFVADTVICNTKKCNLKLLKNFK